MAAVPRCPVPPSSRGEGPIGSCTTASGANKLSHAALSFARTAACDLRARSRAVLSSDPITRLQLRSQVCPATTLCAGRTDDLTRSRTAPPTPGKYARITPNRVVGRQELGVSVRVTSADLGRWLLGPDTSMVTAISAGSVGQLVHSTKGVTWLCRH